MTDNDIVKALECCTTKGAKCSDCPAFKKVDRSDCKKYFRGAIDIIKRQKADREAQKGVIKMIVYENDDYAVSQSEINKHIMIIKKLPDDKGKMIFHCQRKETEPILTKEQGKNFLQNVLDLIGF